MIVENTIKFRRLIPIIWKRLAKMTLLSSLIVIPIVIFDLQQLTISLEAPLILGTAISIFLGFRTNSAHDRWFLGRSLWGEVGASTRNLALLCGRVDESYKNRQTGKVSTKAKPIMRRIINRALALMWVLGRQLKDLPPTDHPDLKDFLEQEELESLKDTHNPALKLLFNQSKDFRAAYDEGQFIDGEHFEYVAIQRELASLMTRCYSLKNTRFPTHYTYFTDLFVWLLVVLLSFSLPANESNGLYAIPIAVLIGWIFSMIEGIGDYMDYPWANNRNVVPTDFLTRGHEIDIRAYALGQTENLPPELKPVEGALY